MKSAARGRVAAFFLSAAAAISLPGQVPAPNVVFILADDLGYADLGCYGASDIRTPHLDRLAREGVRLTDFYANGPVCTPTRSALMTGRYQQRIGGLEWAIPPGAKHLGLPPAEKTIARLLRDAGWATALAGKWHLGYSVDRAPNHHGFERFFGLLSGNHHYFTHRENNGEHDLYLDERPFAMEGYTTRLLTRHALQFLEAMRGRRFFLYLAYSAPHFPYQGPDDRDLEIDLAGWGRKGSRATYAKMVEAMDEGVGEVLAWLDRSGLARDTLVVFTSDNGGTTYSRNAPFSGAKGELREGGLRVPCIARWPARLPAGSVSDQAGMTMDWTASIAALAGVRAPEGRAFDGLDLLPILAGKEPPRRRTLFWRRVDVRFLKTHRAVRDGDWKYIDEPGGKIDLHDLAKDSGEKKDLAGRLPERAAAMRKLIDAWEADVDPPLYPVARPAREF